MNRVMREIRGKFLGVLLLFLPVIRVALGIDVLDTIPVNWQVLIGSFILLIWIYYATRPDVSKRGDFFVTTCLILWATLLTLFTQF